jgi:putative transposase
MPRIARVVVVDYPHHVTQRGNNRSPVFFDDEGRNYYLESLINYSRKYRMEIWAYCLMNNHVHLLAVPREPDSMANCMGLSSMVYTQYLNRKFKKSGRIWQNRFFSCIVEKNQYLWSVARYIERNPVGAGMVEKAVDYRWSSARTHLYGWSDKVLSGDEWLTPDERSSYAWFLTEDRKNDEELIRKATSTGRPLGSEGFIERLEKSVQRNLRPRKRGRPRIK